MRKGAKFEKATYEMLEKKGTGMVKLLTVYAGPALPNCVPR